MATPLVSAVNVDELRGKVQDMYRRVARDPQGEFHFEMGRALAERLGYEARDLDAVPPEAIASFAGVGHHFDLAGLREGESVLDLGSGSGMDSFIAALRVGETGSVVGVDMTDAQLEKADALRHRSAVANVTFRWGLLEALPVEAGSADCVISNGVINLCADKASVFREVHRVLRPGGRLALSDIVSDRPLPDNVTCNATLWAACIGGAEQLDRYRALLEEAGLGVLRVRENPAYRFLSRSAQNAARQYGVRSVSVLAERRG